MRLGEECHIHLWQQLCFVHESGYNTSMAFLPAATNRPVSRHSNLATPHVLLWRLVSRGVPNWDYFGVGLLPLLSLLLVCLCCRWMENGWHRGRGKSALTLLRQVRQSVLDAYCGAYVMADSYQYIV